MDPASLLEEVFSDEEEEEGEVFPPPREGEELQNEEEEEEEGEEEEEDGDGAQMFSAWMNRYRGGQAGAGRRASSVGGEEEEENTEQHGGNTDTLSTSFLPPAARRRSSLPCPSTLSAMQLSRLHTLSEAPVSASVLLHRTSSRNLLVNAEVDPATPQPASAASQERRCSLIPPPIPEVSEEGAPKRTQFRRRNVMSLSDADSTCLICHDDLHKAGKQIRELQCAHSFHNECIDVWLWRKRACPTCRVPAVSNSVDWGAARVKVP